MQDLDALRYPIGKYSPLPNISPQQRLEWIKAIETLPAALRHSTAHLSEAQLDTPYRPEGWTLRQTVHHVADSHMNAYIRFKLALTEVQPTIKPYEEALWAELPDSRLPIAPSLEILQAVHLRWTSLMHAMSEADWQRTFLHPASGKVSSLQQVLGLYAWHGAHHTAHITRTCEREAW